VKFPKGIGRMKARKKEKAAKLAAFKQTFT
jgi:hypothetical protein